MRKLPTLRCNGFRLRSISTGWKNGITLSSAEGAPGDVVEFELSVKNMEAFVAFQTEIPLGDNLSYVENSAVLYRNADHELVASVVNGVLKIYAFSLSNSEFQDNDGKIASFQLKFGTNPGIFLLHIICNIAASAVLISTGV